MKSEIIVRLEKQENWDLQQIIFSKDEDIERLERKLNERDDKVAVLKRALTAKDGQLLSIVRDRDRYRQQVERFEQNPLVSKGRAAPCLKSASSAVSPSAFRSKYESSSKISAISGNYATPKVIQELSDGLCLDLFESPDSFIVSASKTSSTSPDNFTAVPFRARERVYVNTIKQLQKQLKEKDLTNKFCSP